MTHMRRALTLARRALGSVSPNPAVGAVLVKDGVVVGEGWTQPPGQDHAEIVALRLAGPSAAGAVLYTTLEPCVHHGRTPPCTQAIIEAGVSEVRAAMADPNPQVSGNGLAFLEQAGISAIVGEGEEKVRRLIEAYTKFITTGRPFVTAKFAMSLDGKIATHAGDSKWITSDRSRWYTHRLRADSDAILAGVNTVVADDPLLTARNEKGVPRASQPLRVIVDSRGRLPEGARLLKEPGRTLLAAAKVAPSGRARLEKAGARVLVAPGDSGAVDLAKLLRLLGRDERVTSVLVEGGATILGSLFDLGLVDKVVAFIAPTIIGGQGAPSPVAGAGVDTMVEALKLRSVQWKRFGRDMAIIGYC